MIEAVCDGCGKRTELKCYVAGFSIPEEWKLEAQYDALTDETHYRMFCFNCRKDLVKKVEE